MRKKKLPESLHKTIELWPVPRRFTVWGAELRRLRDRWFVAEASRSGLVLRNQRTGHVLELGADHIWEFRTMPSCDGALVLRSQITLCGPRVLVAPLLPWRLPWNAP